MISKFVGIQLRHPCSVGKTTLVNTYLHGQPLASPEPTLGADLSSKQLTVKELNLSLQVVAHDEHRFCNVYACWQVSAHTRCCAIEE